MLWDVRALMKPALSVIDMIPDIHRTAALSTLRRTVLDGKPMKLRLSAEEKDLIYHDAATVLTSPIGGRVLLDLYRAGHLKLKKPPRKSLPTLEAYAAQETEFRARVSEITAAAEARQARLDAIIADPDLARPDELSVALIDRIMTRRFGHATAAQMQIAGLACFRELITPEQDEDARTRAEPRLICWWRDAQGNRQGDSA